MASQIGRSTKIDIRTSLDTKIARAFQQKILKKIDAIIRSSSAQLKVHIGKEFINNKVIQSILGKVTSGDGLTLRGEFGLTLPMARDATSTLISVIADKTKVVQSKNSILKNSTSSTVRNLLFFLTIEVPDTSEIMKSIPFGEEPFSYVSKKKVRKKRKRGQKGSTKIITSPRSTEANALIQWFTWLMYPRLNLFQEQLFDFDIDDFGIMKRKTNLSRSGEAVMVRGSKRSVRFPYSLPKFIVPNGDSENFIEDFFRTKSNKDDMIALVKRIFKSKVRGLR